jgi:hypothetical protein
MLELIGAGIYVGGGLILVVLIAAFDMIPNDQGES